MRVGFNSDAFVQHLMKPTGALGDWVSPQSLAARTQRGILEKVVTLSLRVAGMRDPPVYGFTDAMPRLLFSRC